MSGLLPVIDAQSRLFSLARPLETETVPIEQASGRWLAEDVCAHSTRPASDLSAMDGYALRFAELPGPFTIVGESAAGAALGKPLQPGEAARIFTGAPVPTGADTVLMQEEAAREGDRLVLDGDGPGAQGRHIRTKGRDFDEGDVLLHSGSRMTAPRLALAIFGGRGEVTVRRKPKVAILSTGDELVKPGKPTGEAQIPASNGPMLIAQLSALPVEIFDCGIIKDDEDTLVKAIKAASDADILVTIGGASVGDYDLVQPALKAAGGELDFWRIAMRPGKPLLAGTLGKTVTLGLPGNPASAFVTAKLFLEPLIAHLSGASCPLPHLRTAILASNLPANSSRERYYHGRWNDNAVEALDQQSSASLVALAGADVLIRRKIEAQPVKAGDTVQILPLG